ncbi:MAG: hypothetical protein ACK55Z_01250, partial [bacterium]
VHFSAGFLIKLHHCCMSQPSKFRSLTPCRGPWSRNSSSRLMTKKNGADTGLPQPMETLAILLRTNRTQIHNCQ